MSILICKTLFKVRFGIRCLASPHHFYISQIHPYSSSLASTDQPPNQQSFAVNYLVNSCGFPLEKAITSSKRLKFQTPEQPDSVIAFLCNHGFTNAQALNIIRKVPQVLLYKPEKTLLPKLEFFKSKGVSSTDLVNILSTTPGLLETSLENKIIPVFYFAKNLIGSEESTLFAIKQFAGLFLVDLETRIAPNVEILQNAGVPVAKIAYLLTYQPRTFYTTCERFRQMVEEVKGMGFNPLSCNFVLAVHTLITRSKFVWEKKIEVYKTWGFSEQEILGAFRMYPLFMAVSEEKITRVMEFWVNEMGLDSSIVVGRPQLLAMSFEKRIMPRCFVYQAFQAKRQTKKPNISLRVMLECPEKLFIKKVVNWTKEEAPELLKLYKEKLALARYPTSKMIRVW